MRPPLLLFRCRCSTLSPLVRCVSSRRFINIISEPVGGLARRVESVHDPRYARKIIRRVDYIPWINPGERDSSRYAGQLIRRLDYIPRSNFGEQVEKLPRITKHLVAQRYQDYVPGSPPPIRIVAVAESEEPKVITMPESAEVRKITLGPFIKRSFIRRTFHPLDKRTIAVENGERIVRLVRTTPSDPFPELRETERSAISITTRVEPDNRRSATVLRTYLNQRHLSMKEHIIVRPEVKTTYVDTHCRLGTTLQILKDRLGDETIPEGAIDTFVKTMFPKEVVACIDICRDPFSDYHDKSIALDWPEHFKYYFAMGVNPHFAIDYTDKIHDGLVAAMSNPSCVAWGKCGLDYVKSPPSTYATQQAVFKRQLTAAVALDKPIIIHTRKSDEDTLACIREAVPKDHRMHIHCFISGPNLARSILEEYPNSFIGITGVVSYVGSRHVGDLIRSGELPLERILLESDSPHMVPSLAYGWLQREKPLQGRRRTFLVSHSGMIPFVAEKVLEELNEGRRQRGEVEVGLEEVLEITRKNAAKMYGIDV